MRPGWIRRVRRDRTLRQETPYWVLEARKRRLERILRVTYALAIAAICVGLAVGVSAAAARPLSALLETALKQPQALAHARSTL